MNDLDDAPERDHARAGTTRIDPPSSVVRSHIAYGAPSAVDTAKAHGAPLGEDEVRATKEALRLGSRPALPRAGRGLRAHEALGRAATSPRPSGAGASRLAGHLSGARRGMGPRLARSADARLGRGAPRLRPRPKRTRSPRGRPAPRSWPTSSGYVPTMLGGAADLVESTKTAFDGAGIFSAELRGPEHPVRRPRARHGLDRERARAFTAGS